MSYEYLNTRVRAMKARLLSPADFERLMGLPSLEEFVTALEESDYRPEVERASVEHEGVSLALVEAALVRHSERVYRKLYEIAPAGPRELLGLVFERWEAFNIKTVLRGKHVNASEEEVLESLAPAITRKRSFYLELVKQPDVNACVDYLLSVGNRYYKPLTEAFPLYADTGHLAHLERAVDDFYFARSRRTLTERGDADALWLREMQGLEVDALNLVYALRAVEEEAPIEEKYRYILPGGHRLREADVRELIGSRSREEFYAKLKQSQSAYASQVADEGAEAPDTGELQERLERWLFRERCRIEAGHPFDIRLPHAYLWRKYVELTNLRVIASGLERGVPRAEIEGRLIPLDG